MGPEVETFKNSGSALARSHNWANLSPALRLYGVTLTADSRARIVAGGACGRPSARSARPCVRGLTRAPSPDTEIVSALIATLHAAASLSGHPPALRASPPPRLVLPVLGVVRAEGLVRVPPLPEVFLLGHKAR